MNLSVDRQKSLAYLLVNEFLKQGMIKSSNQEEVRRWALKGVEEFVFLCKKIDQNVENKIRSLKRNVIEGSEEWNVLYYKYYEEELIRKGQS